MNRRRAARIALLGAASAALVAACSGTPTTGQAAGPVPLPADAADAAAVRGAPAKGTPPTAPTKAAPTSPATRSATPRTPTARPPAAGALARQAAPAVSRPAPAVAPVRIPARRATLHVAPSGEDAGPGTAARPFATLARAAAAVRAGDVVDVRAGTYRLTDSLWLGTSGTAARRILFRAHPGERVVIDGSGVGRGRAAVGIGGRYVDVQGFEITGEALAGISVWGGAHVRVVGNRVHGQWSAGIFAGYSSAGVVRDVDISGNTVYDQATANRGHVEGGGWGQGITVAADTVGVRVTANRVYHSHGEGIGVMGVGTVVDGNVLYDNWAAGIYVDQGTRATITRNLVYATGDKAWDRYGMPSTSLQIANEGRARPELLTGLRITDNVFVGGRSGIGYWSSYGVGGGLRNSVISHNTVYGSASEDLLVQADAGHRGTTVSGNLFVRHGRGGLADVKPSRGVRLSGNCWSARPPASASGRGDVIGRPSFVKAGGTSIRDYALTARSACRGFGARL